MLVRSMAPQIICCDEIGSKEDIEAINYAVCSGVKGIFTAHGDSFEELMLNSNIRKMIDSFIIERIIILNPNIKGKEKEVLKLNMKDKKYYK